MSVPTREQLEALAARWSQQATDEEASGNGSEYGREALAAGVFEECASDLRQLLVEGAR